jgi:hypothetical protein
VELRHLVAELVDEAAAASAGARVEVDARLEPDGALASTWWWPVRGWTDALGASRGNGAASAVAERLARRSTGGIRLERPLIDHREGWSPPWSARPRRLITRRRRQRPLDLAGDVHPPPAPSALPDRRSTARRDRATAATSCSARCPRRWASSARRSSKPSRRLVPRRRARARDGRLGHRGRPRVAEASARATRTEAPQTTASGLPRRSPGDRLVPPPRASRPSAPPDERVPERVATGWSTYQRGLQQGRHRAADAAPDSDASEAWTADGW